MAANKNLEKLKQLYLDPTLDQEEYEDNLAKITEWEQTIRASEDFLSWQGSDVTLQIIKEAKETYKNLAVKLAINRDLTTEQRASIFAKQDAFIWLLSLIEKDAQAALDQIHMEIRIALKP